MLDVRVLARVIGRGDPEVSEGEVDYDHTAEKSIKRS